MVLAGAAGLSVLIVSMVGVLLIVRGHLANDEKAQLATVRGQLDALEAEMKIVRNQYTRSEKRKIREARQDPSLQETPDAVPESSREQRRAAIAARFGIPRQVNGE